MDAINALEAGGSTAGGAGIRLAYDIAKKNFIVGGNNRVILATDGDFNIGESSDASMVRLIEERRKEGVFLTVLGFGTGNLKDSKMEQLADKGNGNYAYIDELMEARKVLVHEMGGTLLTVAKDVKLQVEFNPERVQGYRLIGYENRLLAAEDFNDDEKDAGELGAGHSVTALYEVVPAGIESDVNIRGLDSLRYSRPAPRANASKGRELAFVKLRYKEPDGAKSRLLQQAVADAVAKPSRDFQFASAVAELGMVLRDSDHRGQATLASALGLARDGMGPDREGYRAEFIRLVEQIRALDLVADDPDAPGKAPRRRH
jgi:Ca-activated chloride channel family protein